jgi:hypothetical protein
MDYDGRHLITIQLNRLNTSGVTVARAKRTARADARRRYRAEQAPVDTISDEELDLPSVPLARAGTGTQPPPEARRGIAAAFREAFHPLDLRADLRTFPTTARNKALWIPILLTLISTVLFIARPPTSTSDFAGLITSFLFQYFIVTPGIGAAFIAGFLAPRASWLLGAIVGIVSAICYSFLGLGGYIPVAANAPKPVAQDVVLAAFTIGPILGAFFASAAAWYRRFLMLNNPNRGQGRRSASAARRPDGRSRAASAGQKAGIRR